MSKNLKNRQASALIRAYGVTKLAKKLKITPGSISQWDVIPPKQVPKIARLLGCSYHLLRPDLYEEENTQERAEQAMLRTFKRIIKNYEDSVKKRKAH